MQNGIEKWNLSSNIIVVRFPPLAGGKFLISMLSYFDKFLFPMNVSVSNKNLNLLNYNDLSNLTHNLKINSVPMPECKEFWPMFEMRPSQFWGFNLSQILNNDSKKKKSLEETYDIVPDVTKELLKKYFCFFTIHQSTLKDINQILPNCIIVNLIDFEELQNKSNFKQHDSSQRYLDNIEGPNVINFSMKNVFNYGKFLLDLKNLASEISKDSKLDSKHIMYYKKYIEIHSK